MNDRYKIGEEIKVLFCWHNYCSECILHRYNCLNTTSEEAIMIAKENKDIFLKKFRLINDLVGENDVRDAAFRIVVGAKMK